MGLSDVMEDIKIPVYVEEADLPMMMDGESNLSSGLYARRISVPQNAVPVRDGQRLQITELSVPFGSIHRGITTGRIAAIIRNRKMFFER